MAEKQTNRDGDSGESSLDDCPAEIIEMRKADSTSYLGVDHGRIAQADRVYEACMRAAKVLEYYLEQQDPTGGMPGRYVDAALAEVRELRQSACQLEKSGSAWDLIRIYRQGELLPEQKLFDSVFAEPLRSTDSKGAIDRLLMLAYWIWCNCATTFRLFMPWYEEPDWNELERKTLRLLGAVSEVLSMLRDTEHRHLERVATCADEIAFRVQQFYLTNYEIEALTQCHAPNTVIWGGCARGFASEHVCRMGNKVNECFYFSQDGPLIGIDEEDRGLRPEWYTDEDNSWRVDAEMNGDLFFRRHDEKIVDQNWDKLQAIAQRAPTQSELATLRTLVSSEFAAVRRTARERIPAARFVRVPEPGDLGFEEGPLATPTNDSGGHREEENDEVIGEGIPRVLLDALTLPQRQIVEFLWDERYGTDFIRLGSIPNAFRDSSPSDEAIIGAIKRVNKRLFKACEESGMQVIFIEATARRAKLIRNTQ